MSPDYKVRVVYKFALENSSVKTAGPRYYGNGGHFKIGDVDIRVGIRSLHNVFEHPLLVRWSE